MFKHYKTSFFGRLGSESNTFTNLFYSIYSVFILSIFTISPVHSQIVDMERLEELAAFQAEKIDETDEDPEEAPPEEIDEDETLESAEESSSIDFGYKGREDFLINPKPKSAKEPLAYFGYDFFGEAPTTYVAVTDVPLPPEYVIGPGDEIIVLLYGNKNIRYKLDVTRDGDILLPEIGPISVAGLTFTDLRDSIGQIINSQLIGTQANVTLGALKAMNIFVLGEAYKPGMYTVSSLSSLTNAIFASGGIRESGSLRNIEIKRNGTIIGFFDFYDLLLKGDTSKDIRLMAGDVIFIPPAKKRVAIDGEVERSGIYELKDNEKAADLVNFAGTFRPKADLSSLEVRRIDNQDNGFRLIKVDLNKSPLEKLDLYDGDILDVYPVIERMNSAVLLSGHFSKPGFFPWTPGIRLLDIINYDDLLPMTDLDFALVKRTNEKDQLATVKQINLNHLFDGKEEDNIILNEKDEIIFFPRILTPDMITVDILEDEYKEGLGYTKKSLDQTLLFEFPEAKENEVFNYRVFNYCALEEEQVRYILEEYEELEELEELKELAKNKTKNKNQRITQECRRQLIDPILSILKQQRGNESYVDIYGDIEFPGRFPISEDTTLEDIILAAGGLESESYKDSIEIVNRSFVGKETKFGSKEYNSSQSSNIKLNSFDVITVKSFDKKLMTVNIEGEIFFPGEYPFVPGETLSQVIERAGGLTNLAFSRGALFQRSSLKESERKRFLEARALLNKNIILSSQNSQLGADEDADITQLLNLLGDNIDTAEFSGRLIINLDEILAINSTDIALQDGDEIIIPKVPQTVTVIGEVYNESSHFYNKNLGYKDFIEKSGGSTEFADLNSIYLVKASGSVVPLGSNDRFFRASSQSIEVGDTIVVPVKYSTFSNVRAARDISQIIYQMAIAAAAIDRL